MYEKIMLTFLLIIIYQFFYCATINNLYECRLGQKQIKR